MINHDPQYSDFPEFETLPDEIKFGDDFLEKLEDKSKREKRVQWLERKKGMSANGRSKTKTGWFPPEKRVEVATAFVAGIQNASRLEELTKVPAATIRKWKQQEWWRDLLAKVRYEKDAEFDAKMTGIIDKTLTKIEEGLEKGDQYIDRRTGETRYRPINATQAANIQEKIFKQRQLIRGEPTSRTETLNSREMMKNLFESFRKFAGAPKVIEGEVIDKQIEDYSETEAETENK